MAISVFSLPHEVLLHIFEYLDVRSRLIAGQVCKEWLYTTNCNLLLKNVNLLICSDNERFLKRFPSTTRQFKNFTFCQIEVDGYFLSFLKRISGQLISLLFIQCYLDKDYFYANPTEKITTCDNLQYLEIRGCGAFALFDSLPTVSTLKIYEYSDLTDRDMHEMNKSMPNLVTFKLGSRVAYDPRAYRRFYVKGNTVDNEPSDAILSFPAIKIFIAKRSRTLLSIDLAKTGLTSDSAIEISTIDGLTLQTMLFGNDLSGSRIETFCRNQLTLTSLDLSTALNLSDEILSNICRTLVNLRELVIIFKHKIDVGIIDIFKLKQLQKLNLNFCSNISPASFMIAAKFAEVVKLKHLNLAFTKIPDKAIRGLLSLNKDIERLDLTFTNISNRTLHFISKYLVRLKSLILNNCKFICGLGLCGKHPEFWDCGSSEACVPISNLKELRLLDLSKNCRITEDECTEAIRFKHLEVLKLYDCDYLEDSSVAIDLLMLNPSLKELKLANDLDD